MASIALHRKSNPHKTLLKSITFSHFFSSSSSDNDNPNPNPNNLSSYFSDIKSKLQQQQQQQQPPQQPPSRGGAGGSGGGGGDGGPVEPYPFSNSLSDITAKLKQHQQQQAPRFRPAVFGSLGANSGSDSKDEITRNLAEFRRRATSDGGGGGGGGVPLGGGGERRNQSVSFDVIKESLSKMRMSQSENNGQNKSNMSFNYNVRALQPPMPDRGGGGGGSGGGNVFGGSALPMTVFGKEMNEKKGEGDGGGDEVDMWIRPYDLDELGKKLRELRPEVKGKKGEFSVAELNERLKKVKENDRKEQSSLSGQPITELRRTLSSMKFDAKTNNANMVPLQGIDILGPGTPKFMLSPPKEHLVEKYFHPDNMSAAEKLKIELKKVRDEFKMHESDCGSTRVQIAQLTTEILHLSSVLLKKDKHSRRGLQAKVQQRKKLLKYLRRTDWDSYCFVLSKLGLRDNPDYKN